jgi:hypothetical protein
LTAKELKEKRLVVFQKERISLPNALGNGWKEKGKGMGQGALGGAICSTELAAFRGAASKIEEEFFAEDAGGWMRSRSSEERGKRR